MDYGQQSSLNTSPAIIKPVGYTESKRLELNKAYHLENAQFHNRHLDHFDARNQQSVRIHFDKEPIYGPIAHTNFYETPTNRALRMQVFPDGTPKHPDATAAWRTVTQSLASNERVNSTYSNVNQFYRSFGFNDPNNTAPGVTLISVPEHQSFGVRDVSQPSLDQMDAQRGSGASMDVDEQPSLRSSVGSIISDVAMAAGRDLVRGVQSAARFAANMMVPNDGELDEQQNLPDSWAQDVVQANLRPAAHSRTSAGIQRQVRNPYVSVLPQVPIDQPQIKMEESMGSSARSSISDMDVVSLRRSVVDSGVGQSMIEQAEEKQQSVSELQGSVQGEPASLQIAKSLEPLFEQLATSPASAQETFTDMKQRVDALKLFKNATELRSKDDAMYQFAVTKKKGKWPTLKASRIDKIIEFERQNGREFTREDIRSAYDSTKTSFDDLYGRLPLPAALKKPVFGDKFNQQLDELYNQLRDRSAADNAELADNLIG